jgi:hypothetical protein
MKLKAIILVVFFFAYMAEILALSVSMNESPAKVCPSKMSCAMQAKKEQKQQCPKSKKPCSPGAGDCLNCPLFYCATIPPAQFSPIPSKLARSPYSIFIAGYQYQYLSSSWKPPNMG